MRHALPLTTYPSLQEIRLPPSCIRQVQTYKSVRIPVRVQSKNLGPHWASCSYHAATSSSSERKNTKKNLALHSPSRTHRAGYARRRFPDLSATGGEIRVIRPDALSSLVKMKCHIRFITTPTSDTPGTALLLHFDDKRYIFGNLHEGLQRAALQSGVKFLKCRDLFLTGRTEWKNTGGMLGLILTLADGSISAAASKAETARLRRDRKKDSGEAVARSGKGTPERKGASDCSPDRPVLREGKVAVEEDPTLRIHGGANLTHTLATARSFIFRQGMPIDVDEINEEDGRSGEKNDWKPTFSDNRVQVWAMPISPTDDSKAASPQPVSPRKRSLGEYISDDKTLEKYIDGRRPSREEVADQWNVQASLTKIPDEFDQQVRLGLVTEMFKSKWRFDNLVKTPLHEVKLPATIFVRDAETKKLAKYGGPLPGGNDLVPNIDVYVRQPWPGAIVDHLPPTRRSPVAMSYIVRTHKQRGKFRRDLAEKLKIPPGPLRFELTQGRSVTSTDGKTITPEMVLEPGKDGGGVAIIDIPSKEYIPNLFQRIEFTADRVMTGVGSFIWLLGPGVAEDERLMQFMGDFKDMKHIVSSPDVCANDLTMTSAASAFQRHHLIDPARYRELQHYRITSKDDLEHRDGSMLFRPAQKGLKVQIEPEIAVLEDSLPNDLDDSPARDHVSRAVLLLAKQAHNETESAGPGREQAEQGLPSPEALIVCLGTGSSLPSLHRNVSATLLRVPECGSYLFDCGENTLGQLQRMYSPNDLREILRDLKLIWISHLHADHHLGTASVIKAWYNAVHGSYDIKRQKPRRLGNGFDPERILGGGRRLFVVGPPHMTRWLEEYSSVEDFGFDQIVPLVATRRASNTLDRCYLGWNNVDVGFNSANSPNIRSMMREATSLENLMYCSVSHCVGANAVSLTFPTGFKFSYSGDCRPSKRFAEIGKGSTVLLHEATFEDELKHEALAKKHSTIGEAVGVGMAMGARRVLLTHFSQRYSTIPNMNDLAKLAVKLDDSEDPTEGPLEEIDAPVDIPPEAPEPMETLLDAPIAGNGQQARQEGTDEDRNDYSRNLDRDVLSFPLQPTTDMKIGVAFDYMSVKVKDIENLEKYTPALRKLYEEDSTGVEYAMHISTGTQDHLT